MQHQFYDVKKKQKVTADVTEKVTYKNEKTGRTSYAFKAQTSDGRSLTAFVDQATWEEADLDMKKAA